MSQRNFGHLVHLVTNNPSQAFISSLATNRGNDAQISDCANELED